MNETGTIYDTYGGTEWPPHVLPVETDCDRDSEFEKYFQYFVAGTSVLVVLVFSILERRTAVRCGCDRPGMILLVQIRRGTDCILNPVNLLDDTDGRFGYAAAFGSTTSAIWNLFTNPQSYYADAPNWSKTLVIMGSVLYVGMLYYPLFACLTTPWIFMGSSIGLFYSGAWFLYNIREVIECPDGRDDNGLAYQAVAQRIPVLLCLFALILIFTLKFVKHTIQVIRNSNTRLMEKHDRKPFAADYNRLYVRRLLTPGHRSQMDQYEEMAATGDRERKFRHYVSKWIYKNDPTFRYSTKVICVLTVSLICAYEFGIVIILLVNQIQAFIPYLYPAIDNETLANSTDVSDNLHQARLALRVFSISVIISFILSSILTVFSIFRILVHYRKNLKLMFKGTYSHFAFNRDNRRPQFIMSDSLSYAGSQVGYILWGYIIMFTVLLLLCFLLAYLIILPLAGEVSKELLLVLVNAIPAIAIYQGLVIIQQLSSWTLLQSASMTNKEGKETTKSVLAVDNRKIYHNMSYFLFFFYIVLGVFGCLVTIIKGMILGIFYLARLDMCGLCRGFEQWDRGYMYYLSFLYVEESHRHPVMLVFCDILYDFVHRHDNVKLKRYGATDEESSSGNDSPNHVTKQISLSPESRLIHNRWLKAYTLIKNPSIVKPEQDGDTSCDSDDILIDLDGDHVVDRGQSATLLEC